MKYTKCSVEIEKSPIYGEYYIALKPKEDKRIYIGYIKDTIDGFKIKVGTYTNYSFEFNEALQLVFDFLNVTEE